MNSLSEGQRVVVVEAAGIAINAPGTVERIRGDGGAWVALDRRSKIVMVHPFAADSDRGTHVLAFPDKCRLAEGNAKERRAARRARSRPIPTPDNFGKDHWSTFLYLETRIVDQGGVIDKRNMRCDRARHPMFAHDGGDAHGRYPTRLRNGELLSHHDDWDCIEDLMVTGLVEWNGTATHPVFALTDLGWQLAGLCRRWRAEGRGSGTFGDSFTICPGGQWSFHPRHKETAA